METRTLRFGTIKIISKNLIHFCYNKGIEVGVNEMQEIIQILVDYVAENGKIKLVLEIPPTTMTNLEAMTYLNENKYKNENTIAVALVTKAIAQRLNSKFYHTKVEVGVPTEFFKSVEEALTWLSQV
ncbi:MAG: hypothetical protein N4A35_07650 [Flavobacteriales bacterium]|jgi:hypothetical protein|nr:hypothetical protein [Flavobacteriales bacterium]